MRKIVLKPLRRIEGEAGLELVLDSRGRLRRMEFVSDLFRGFESFCKGRPVEEMPFLASRICGICAEAHYLASLKALDQIFGCPPGPSARRVRRVFHLSGFLRDHLTVLALFALPETAPEGRDALSLLREGPLWEEFLEVRRTLAEVLSLVGGRRLHGGAGVPGGWRISVSSRERDALYRAARRVREGVVRLTEAFWKVFVSRELVARGRLPAGRGFLALVPNSTEGRLHLGTTEGVRPLEDYRAIPTDTTCMVGPWARFLLWPAPKDEPLRSLYLEIERCLKQLDGLSLGLGHALRVYETLQTAVDLVREVEDLEGHRPEDEPEVVPRQEEGIGMVEAPRGLLVHHYRVDERGRMVWLHILTPTARNLRPLREDLENFLYSAEKISDKALNEIESLIRCYDPCVPCMLHLILPRTRKTFRIYTKGFWPIY